jgi:hypothetical protein
MHKMEKNPLPRWRRWTIDGDDNPPTAGTLRPFNKRHDLSGEIGDVVHQCDRPCRRIDCEPIVFYQARVTDPRLGGIGHKASAHRNRGLDVDDLAAMQGERQRNSAGAASDIDDDIIRLDIRCNGLEVRVRRSMRIGLHERVIAWQAREQVSRRLPPAQSGALREHGIDPSSIPLGCVVAVDRHRGILPEPCRRRPCIFGRDCAS